MQPEDLFDSRRRLLPLLAAMSAVLVIFGGSRLFHWKRGPTIQSILADCEPPQAMTQHAVQYSQPEVIKVTESIHVAIGFALANSIWLSGPEGVTIVDTTESKEAAREVLKAMREVIQDPIKGIIYTHSHVDHCFGTEVFIEHPEQPPVVWAHRDFWRGLDNEIAVSRAIFRGAMRQFGVLISGQTNAGIGKKLQYNKESTMGLVAPTKFTSEDGQDIMIAGLSMRLIHIPGETEDQIGIWLPEQRAFLCADDLYKAFPNVYAIRGTSMRNARKWIASLDRMRELRPRYLVPGHGQPIEGEEKIYHILTVYRDGLQYVHDQTVRYINQGMYPEDIARLVRLPEELAKEPYLEQMYGTVEWTVRSVFDQYVGWFSGNVADLAAITSTEKAEKMIRLAGGESHLLQAAQDALDEGDARWALVLASHILDLNKDHDGALDVRLGALKALARQMTSTNGRHYYITVALEDHRLVVNEQNQWTIADRINHLSPRQIFNKMQTQLMPEAVEGIEQKVLFNFTDIDEIWFAHLRRGIIEITLGEQSDWDLRLSTTLSTFRGLVARTINPIAAFTTGRVTVDGGMLASRRFFSYFEQI